MNAGSNFSKPRARPALIWRLVAAAALTYALLLAVALGRIPNWLLLYAPSIGVVSAFAYWIDKRAATRGEWRIPELCLPG